MRQRKQNALKHSTHDGKITTLWGYRNALQPHQNPNQCVLKRCLATLWLWRLVADAFPPEGCLVRSLASVLWCCSLWWCAVRHGLRGSFTVLRHMHMFKGNHDAGGVQSLTRTQIWSSVVTRLLSEPAAQELAAQPAGLASQVAQAAVPKPDTDRNHHENDTSSEAQWLHGCCLILRPRNWLHNLLVLRHRWLRRRFQSLTQTEITMKTTQVLKLSGYTAAVWSCGPGTGCTTCWSCVTGGSGGGSKAWHRQKSPWKRHKFWSSVVTRLLSDPAAQELAAQLAGLASQVAQVAVPKPDTDRNHHENDTSSEANWLHGCCLILRPRNWLHNLLVLLHRWLRRRFQSLTQTEITMKTTQVLKLSGYTAAVWSCGPGTGCTTCWSCFTGGSGGGSKAWHRQKSPWKRHKFWS